MQDAQQHLVFQQKVIREQDQQATELVEITERMKLLGQDFNSEIG